MKKLLLLTFFASSLVVAQTPCDNTTNMAGIYPCNDYALLSNIPLSTFEANSSSDSWGWTDSTTGKEYAIIALRNGSGYVDVSDPINPIYLGKLISPVLNEFQGNWHDVKVYNNYAFIVSEINGHGMQIFDLTKLRDVSNAPVIFEDDGVYTGFGSAHNIAINEDSGFAYGIGTNTFSGGPHFVNIQDPENPTAAGGFSGEGYTHDAQVVMYNGPDEDYQGIELFVGSNEDRVVFVDVSDKGNPQTLSEISYSDAEYTHQGWFTEDQKYFVVTDELDEVFNGNMLRLIIMDMTDLDNPVEHMQYIGETPAVDHNVYVKGDKIYLSAYSGGMRVLDISDIDNMNIEEVGYFDTWPADDRTSASIGDPGAWNVYPFFESGNLIITNFSDNGGMFVVTKNDNILSSPDIVNDSFSVFPNPTTERITITSEGTPINHIEIYDMLGKRLSVIEASDEMSKELNMAAFESGIYLVNLNKTTTLKIVKR